MTNLRALARRHLEAEELAGLALMRAHATASEAREPRRRILADLPTSHMAWLLRPLVSDRVEFRLANLLPTSDATGDEVVMQWCSVMCTVERWGLSRATGPAGSHKDVWAAVLPAHWA